MSAPNSYTADQLRDIRDLSESGYHLTITRDGMVREIHLAPLMSAVLADYRSRRDGPLDRKDAARLDFLEREANEEPLTLHSLPAGQRIGHRGLGLSVTGRTLRQAIDHMMRGSSISAQENK